MNRREFIKGCAAAAGLVFFRPVFSANAKITELLRPPFSVKEKDFMKKCNKCGICAKVCPVKAIQFFPKDHKKAGTPVIIPSEQHCTLCMKCVSVCPTGAIVKPDIKTLADVYKKTKIGTAEIVPKECFAYLFGGCKVCYKVCPVEPKAISMEIVDGKKVPVILSNCTGCGACEHACPANPKAVMVKSIRDSENKKL